MDSPLLSIIIVSYNTRGVLQECLASVEREVDQPHETIVIDNASPDGSADMVAQAFPEVTLVRNTVNVGFSPANNTGMERARGRYVVLLNPDTIVQPGAMRAWTEAHERVQATISGTRLVGRDGALQISAWRVPDLRDATLELFMLHRLLKRNAYPVGHFDTDFQAGFVSGAAMLFQRSVFGQQGGLDPEMFWMEDADLCLRITQGGGSCWFVNGPGIVHIGGESAKRNIDRMIANQLLSRIKFARKHGSAVSAWLMVLVIVLHALTRAVAFSVLGLVRDEPRARAYRHTLARLYRYLFHGDRSI